MNLIIHDHENKLRYSKEVVRDAVHFFADRLFEKLTDYSSLHLEISLDDRDPDGTLGETVTYDFDDVETPEFIDIVLANDLSDKEFMVTLAHEMVHVKQLAMGELIVCPDSLDLSWYKKPRNKKSSYWDTPWEKEAEEKEYNLYAEWLSDNGEYTS